MPVGAVGAQHQPLPPGEGSADELGLEAPILPDRAARQQQRRLGQPDIARAARLGEKAREHTTRSNRGNGVAAIDREDRAGHIGAGRRRQEQQRAVEVGRLADALQAGRGRSAPCRHRSGKRRG